ncbi:MAG: HAD-IIIC family phosphatase [Clostridia bacterium]|nr:HAD-IIIC family phosphatase [Clostridia bacterium]
MFAFEKIKLIIWDLDETLWQGTLSEEQVALPDAHAQLVRRLTDIGIVNSICSKNDWEPVRAELEKLGLLEYFVFPSVSWEAKGTRVKKLIEDMQLRPQNVLFLDDNHSNREEVRYFCPEIMVEGPEAIEQLCAQANACQKRDPEHKRLKQYKVLEEKHHEKANYTSNEAFLMESGIRVEIGHDCLTQLDRIHDLILRANQLNFTKLRSGKDELRALLEDPSIETGYCSVSDRFGDYGIVGFYALKARKLIHFAFSCRTLGMGIEQYMYNTLGRPELEIAGEVISDLSSAEIPAWINRAADKQEKAQMQIENLQAHTVLVKGPCDLFQVYPYIAQTELFDTEFTYSLPSGLTIESTGHTTHIVEAHRLTAQQKQRVLSEVPFTDAGMYSDAIYKNGYKVVFISILSDANLGVYRRKKTGEHLAFLEYIHPITDPESWPGLIQNTYPTAGFRFTEEVLKRFSEEYEFIGRNTPQQILENLQYIRAHLPKDCVLAVMLGGEIYYEKNTFEAYMDRHIVHREINALLRSWAEKTDGVRLLDVNRYLVDQRSFYDHFNHYIKPVYYALAGEMVEIVNSSTGSSIRETSRLKMMKIRIKEMLAPVYYKLRKWMRRAT